MIALLAGCSSLVPASFHIVVPAEPGGGPPLLPVHLIDHTGSVAAVEQGTAPLDPLLRIRTLIAVPDRSDAIFITWIAGACDESVEFRIRPGIQRRVVMTTTRRADGCDGMGFDRSFIVLFNQPISPDDFLFTISR